MNGNIVGEPFDEFVGGQINTRQTAQFSGYGNSLRTDDQLKYLTNRNAWVKLASSVDVLPDSRIPSTPEESVAQRYGLEFIGTILPLGESKLSKIGIKDTSNYLGTKLAEKAVLFNTISSFNSINTSYSSSRAGVTNVNDLWSDSFAYGIGGTDFGIQPPPGITGATVDSINRGSIRKATVTLKAHNKFQFDIIELLYLRLGFTMMLEWGWDKYLDNETGDLLQVGNTIIEEKWFTSTGISQLEMLGHIQDKRKEYDGNYDGFFGKVSNFTWNFNPDGTYDISIDLITIGDVIESIKVNTSNKQEFKIGKDDLNLPIEQLQNLKDTLIEKSATLNTIGSFLYQKIGEISVSGSLKSFNGTVDYFSLSDIGGSRKPSSGPIYNPYSRSDYVQYDPNDYVASTNTVKENYYIRLGEFLTQLENRIIPKIQNDGKTPIPQITFEKFINRISYFPNQIALDPKICIFKPPLNSYGDITGINDISFVDNKSNVIDLATYYVANTVGNAYGLLMNLYLNINFISDLLLANGGSDQQLSLFKFLQDLCNGINNALGGVNKLEPIIKDDYIVTIIDQTFSDLQENPVILEVYSYNPVNQTSNFVKDIKFVSKITPQLASMISIGATAAGSNTSEIDGTAFSKWSAGLVDRFSKEILEPSPDQINSQTLPNEQLYRNKFNTYKNYTPPTAPVSTNSTVYRIINALSDFISDILEEDSNTTGTNSPSNEVKIIDDDLYPTLTGPMTFVEFHAKAYAYDKRLEEQNIFTFEGINERVGSNYAIYLIQAFGGVSGQVKVISKYSSTPKEYTYTDSPRYMEFNDTFISQGKSAYKAYINNLNTERFKTDSIPSSEVGFIPLSFELILDGISGIKIYNKLNINNKFLPSNYPESLSFIITKVNHNISNNSWDTSLSTISIPRTEPYKFIPSQVSNNGIESVASTLRKDPKTLTTSNRGIEFIKKKEDFIPYAYDDKSGRYPPPPLTATTKIVNNKIVATGGTLSIGYGFTNAVSRFLSQPIVWNSTMTQAEADEIITKIIRESFEKTLQRTITAPLTQYEFDALISILYNAGSIGNESAGLPTPLKDTLNNRDYQGAANIIPRYRITQNGLPNTSLQSRRAKEQQVFISGNYGL